MTFKNKKTCYVFRHVHNEDLGSLREPLLNKGLSIEYIEVPSADENSLINAKNADLLIVLGGPIGVYDTESFPFLNLEIEFLKKHLHDKKPTLGICLGAQLIAHALGSKVFPSGAQEIGWFPISINPDLPADHFIHSLFQNNSSTDMFHWHGDTFELPKGAIRLASSAKTQEQGFSFEDHVLALQFHPEIELPTLESWLITNAHELSSLEGKHDVPNIVTLRKQSHKMLPELMRKSPIFFQKWLEHISI